MDQPLVAVVDDEQDLLENFTSLLEDQYQVKAFNSPAAFLQALPELKQQGVRLVVSDFKMPGLTGLEMIQKAITVIPNLPFVILSGFLDKKTVMDAVELGVFRILEKPCDPEVLLSAVDQLLMEADLQNTRTEIRKITSQLREFYSTIRIALMQHIPADVLDRLIVDSPGESTETKMSFEKLLENLEQRLDQLLTSEKMINDLKGNRLKE